MLPTFLVVLTMVQSRGKASRQSEVEEDDEAADVAALPVENDKVRRCSLSFYLSNVFRASNQLVSCVRLPLFVQKYRHVV